MSRRAAFDGRPLAGVRPNSSWLDRRPERMPPSAPALERWAGTSTSRSEEHPSALQSIMRNSYAVSCLKNKKHKTNHVYRLLTENKTTNQKRTRNIAQNTH